MFVFQLTLVLPSSPIKVETDLVPKHLVSMGSPVNFKRNKRTIFKQFVSPLPYNIGVNSIIYLGLFRHYYIRTVRHHSLR